MNYTDQKRGGMNDLIFENRNRMYGAYALRRSYDRNILKGLLATCLSFLLLGAGVTLFKNNPEIVKGITGTTVDTMISIDEGPEDPVIDEPRKTPSGGSVSQSTFVPVDTFALIQEDTVTALVGIGKGKDTSTFVDPGNGGGGGGGTIVIKKKDTTIYVAPPVLAKFNGDFHGYLTKNIHYPQSAKEIGLEGVVFVNFTVDFDGSVVNLKVLNNPNELFRKEALRVIAASPNWQPASDGENAVRSSMTVPIRFKLK